MIMHTRTIACTLVIMLATPACGPAGITMDDEVGEGQLDDDSDGTESSEPESSESGPSESESGEPSESGSPEDGGTFLSDTGCNPHPGFRCTPTCGVFAQDCPEGEKCVPYASTGETWDAAKCVPVLADQAPGEPCHYDGPVSATDDCDQTSMCWNTVEQAGELIGTCVQFCTGPKDDPTCPEGQQCVIENEGSVAYCEAGQGNMLP